MTSRGRDTPSPIGLVIDTSSAAVTAGIVAVRTDGSVDVLGASVTLDARAHAELLSGHVRAALRSAGTTFQAVSAVIVGAGPGPYTGLRVGVASAAAFAHALGAASYGVVSLDAIGAEAFRSGEAGCDDVLVAADARRREVYWARYRSGRRIGEPAVAKPADLAAALAEDPPTAMTGAGAEQYADALGLPLLTHTYPHVEALGRLAAPRMLAGAPTEVLRPLYLRRPDAEAPTSIKAVLPPSPVPPSPVQSARPPTVA